MHLVVGVVRAVGIEDDLLLPRQRDVVHLEVRVRVGRVVEQVRVRDERERFELAQVDAAREEHDHAPLERVIREHVGGEQLGVLGEDAGLQRRVLLAKLRAERVGGIDDGGAFEQVEVVVGPRDGRPHLVNRR